MLRGHQKNIHCLHSVGCQRIDYHKKVVRSNPILHFFGMICSPQSGYLRLSDMPSITRKIKTPLSYGNFFMNSNPSFDISYGYPVFWNRIRTQRNIARTGQGSPASGGLIQKIGVCPGLDSGRLTPHLPTCLPRRRRQAYPNDLGFV